MPEMMLGAERNSVVFL